MRRFKPILEIVERSRRNSCTDWKLYDMIDELAGKFFYAGVAVGIVAGIALAVAFILGVL